MNPLSAQLPITLRKDEILAALSRHQIVVVCGATGSGKTTQLPQMCLQAGRAAGGKLIGHTQPRRLAARSVAARIAEELGQRMETPGCIVGSKVRFADTTGRGTRIKLMTDGILLAEMQGDPMLTAYDTIIIDEAHERSLNIDFLLGYLTRLLPRRPDLKVIVTSATIDPTRFATLFGAAGGGPDKVPVIEVSGRTFPIEHRYRPVEPNRWGEVDQDSIDDAIADAVRELATPGKQPNGQPYDRGDILVFLPGEREIRSATRAVQQWARGDVEVLPLFAKLSAAQQDRIFKPTPGTMRVILATNIAETSLTVPGIRHVIDTGQARINRYDYRTKITRLQVEPISQASANQRAGRCGRVAPGIAIRLFAEADCAARPVYTDPEIRRVSLASAILRCQSLGVGAIEAFPFIDPPEAKAITEARATLFELGAASSEGADAELTPIGAKLARLPLDPRPARILLQASEEGCLHEALVLVAALSSQDPRERPGAPGGVQQAAHLAFANPDSDYLTLLNYWDAMHTRGADSREDEDDDAPRGGSRQGEQHRQSLFSFCKDACLSYNRTREWIQTYHQLADLADELDLRQNNNPAKPEAIHRAIMAGTLSGVLCRDDVNSHGHNTIYRGIRGMFAAIHPGSALFKKNPKWMLSGEIVQTTKIYARSCCTIKPEWLAELGGHLLERISRDEHFDPKTGEVMTYASETFAGVPVRPRTQIRLDSLGTPAARARARELFITEGLAGGRYSGTDSPDEQPPAWLRHNRAILEQAAQAEARLRRRDVLAPIAQRAAHFDAALPPEITGHAALVSYLAADPSPPKRASALKLTLADVLDPSAAAATDTALFPSELILSQTDGLTGTFTYAFTPGKDGDGLTLTIPLLALAMLAPTRADWLVPGLLPARLAATLKQLPKEPRSALEAKVESLDALARDLAGVLDGSANPPPPLHEAAAEAIEVLTGVSIAPEHLRCRNLSDALQLHLTVVDDAGKPIGSATGEDIEQLRTKLAPRLAKAQASAAKARFQRDGLTAWSFGPLPEQVEGDGEGEGDEGAAAGVTRTAVVRYPALVDAGESVSLTLAETAAAATHFTRGGVRRLLAIAMAGEIPHHLDALPQLEELVRGFKPFGPEAELCDTITLMVAERTFMAGQGPIRDAETFEQRTSTYWGRIATNTKDIAELLARCLDARGKIAHRLSGGTNRNWVASVTDLREHLAYLTPPGCFTAVPPERLEHMPRYLEAARQRLLNLREDGSGAEAATLPLITARFKKLTGYIARHHAELVKAQHAAAEASSATSAQGKPSAGAKAAVIPASRRHTVRINADAATWAIQPGSLPAWLDRYRWLLEDLRVASFAPDMIRGKPVTLADVDAAWQEETGTEQAGKGGKK